MRPQRRAMKKQLPIGAEKMMTWSRERWDQLWDKKAWWGTGPILVASGVELEVFRYLTESMRYRKMNLRYEEDGKQLFICGDGSCLHENARDMLIYYMRRQMQELGFRIDGREPNILVLRGGRVDFPGGIEQQVDSAIYEFRPGESADVALTPLVLEVVHLNESLENLLTWLEKMCEAAGSSTRVAIGIHFPVATTRDEFDFRFSAFVKVRGQTIEELTITSATQQGKIEVEVRDLFVFEDAKGVARAGQKLIIDLVHLRDCVVWTARCPFAAPGYKRKIENLV